MLKRKITELTIPLKTFLQMYVARSPADAPMRLEREIELGKQFNLSRPTVHAALEELEADGWIQHLPGRLGYFSNPDQAVPGTCVIAIIAGNADCRFSSPPHALIAALSEKPDRGDVFYHFLALRDDSEEGTCQQIRSFAYSGVLWFEPNPQFYPAIRRLIAEGVPLVVASMGSAKGHIPEENVEFFDVSKCAEMHRDIIQERNYRHVLYYTTNQYNFSRCKKMIPDNVRYGNLVDANDLNVLQSDPPDAIFADGGFEYDRKLFRVLEQWKSSLPDVWYYQQSSRLMTPECERKLAGCLFLFKPFKRRNTKRTELGKKSMRKLLRLIYKTEQKGSAK